MILLFAFRVRGLSPYAFIKTCASVSKLPAAHILMSALYSLLSRIVYLNYADWTT